MPAPGAIQAIRHWRARSSRSSVEFWRKTPNRGLGQLRLKEGGYLPTSGVHILSATVSEKGGCWFVSLQVAMEIPDPVMEEKPVAGVDLGIHRMAQVSDGTYFENRRALKSALTKLKRLQRVVSRRQKGSANRQKAVRQLAKAHLRAANIRKDALHQATTYLTKTKSAIMLENLNVSAMMQNHPLAQAIADVGMYEFRRQLAYKGGGTAVKSGWPTGFSHPQSAVRSAGMKKRSVCPSGCMLVNIAARGWSVI
jgi:putative transposase